MSESKQFPESDQPESNDPQPEGSNVTELKEPIEGELMDDVAEQNSEESQSHANGEHPTAELSADEQLENEEHLSDITESSSVEGTSVKILTDMQRQIEELQREKKQAQESVLRTQAEMENLRRRVDRDVENAHKFALDKFVNQLLPVVDSLERGIETVSEEDESQKAAREGLVLTLKMLSDALIKFNVEAIDPTGSPFNPTFHEAMAQVPQPDTAPNTVLNTVQKGYSLNGRLVRPAMVVVAK